MVLIKKYDKHMLLDALIAAEVLTFLIFAFFPSPRNDSFFYIFRMSPYASELFSWGTAKTAVFRTVQCGNIWVPMIAFLFSPFRHFGIAGFRLSIFFMNIFFSISGFVFVKRVLKGIFKDNKPLHRILSYYISVVLPLFAIKPKFLNGPFIP